MEVSKADAVLPRSELFSISSRELESRITGWLDARRRLSTGTQIQFDSDLRTESARELLGRALEQLVISSAKEMSYFRVKAMQAGYSGAAIVSITASRSADYSAPRQLIVKISASKFPLEDELLRLPSLGSVFEGAAVLPNNSEIIEHDGFYAIAMREVQNRHLLCDFLRKRGLTAADKKVLFRVVDGLLVDPAKEAKSWESFGLQTADFQLRATAASQIVDFLSETEKLTAILKSSDLRAVKSTKKFVEVALKGIWSFTVKGRLAAQLHGDFHCRNVFVAEGEAPIMIDFGRADVFPRLFDFAALDVDLVLAVWDSSKGEDHRIANIDRWFREVTTFFPYSSRRNGTNTASKTAWLRATLLAAMEREIPSVLPTEYAETVVFHLLRYLRFPNVTLAKKVLATRLIESLTKKFGLAPLRIKPAARTS